MTELILHVGHPKTGSTTLQNALSSNAASLLSQSILYPTQAEPRSHKHALALPVLTGLDDRPLRRRTGLEGEALQSLSAGYWRSLVSEVQAADPDVLILSSESFWVIPQPQQQRFRQRLAEVCDTVTVCGYLRSPPARFLSAMNQQVRMFREILLPEPDYYKSAVQAYQSGKFERFSWNVFSRSQLIDGDIVADFCARHLPPAISAQDLPRELSANESVSNEALAMLEEIKRDYGGAKTDTRDPVRLKIVDLVRQADKAIEGRTRPRLKPEIEAAVIANATDLHWLRDQCGLEFADIDYPAVASGTVDLNTLNRVEDFCPVDQERLKAMQAFAGKNISELYKGNVLRKLFFWR